MDVMLVYEPLMATYRLSPGHPLRPERFDLAVALMAEWGLLAGGPGEARRGSARVAAPRPTADDELLGVHASDYLDFVKRASRDPSLQGYGLGAGDTPAFLGMHEAAVLSVGGSLTALEAVAAGEADRSFNPAGGMHHAARDHASGFCIYNDVAVAIHAVRAANPDIRLAYIDIDAHHGDGVEAAFAHDASVLTVSLHESGRYLFPGTGHARDVGTGDACGSIVNVPLPMRAGPGCYDLAWAVIVEPALRAFWPDLIVLQAGADSHANDPLTHLCQTVEGYLRLVDGALTLADELTEGRLCVVGGGGYRPFDEVPRMWASLLARLLDREVPEDLPGSWLEKASRTARETGHEGPAVTKTVAESGAAAGCETDEAVALTRESLAEVKDSSPLLGGSSSAVGPVATLEKQLADLIDREFDAGF